jgi:hypothetical protein
MTASGIMVGEKRDGTPDLSGAALFFWNGFESRSTKLLRMADASRARSVFGFRFADNQFDLSVNDTVISSRVPSETYSQMFCDRRRQFDTYTSFFDAFSSLDVGVQIVFDITCFPRDVLLIALYALWRTGRFNGAICTYNLAADYSVGAPDDQGKWLSKGIASVSPVIGFRGIIHPERPMQLIPAYSRKSVRLVACA